ncbi:MAG TPA: PorP/SprF family type IX secretion system membrane protein [Bacteroidales bacterium]|nr:PorP/SprF family type IX secretion system membrane protein [Bacteroidales bacterium]
MRKLLKTLMLLLLPGAYAAFGQQFPLSNHYTINPYTLGPQYAGVRSSGEFFFNYRKDWVNINPSPETIRFNANFGVGGGIYLGAEAFLDRVDILERFKGSLSFTYKLQMADEQYLYFGMNGQMYQNSVDLGRLHGDLSDPLFQNLDKLTKLNFNAGWGILYTNPWLEAGLGMPVVLRTRNAYLLQSQGNFAFEREFLFHAAGKLPVADNTFLVPMILVRQTANQPTGIEAAMNVMFNDQFWLGGLYRNSQALAFLAGGKLLGAMQLTYSYETGLGGYHFRSGGTHEITLGFRFGDSQIEGKTKKQSTGGPPERNKKRDNNKRFMLHEYQQMYEQKYKRD